MVRHGEYGLLSATPKLDKALQPVFSSFHECVEHLQNHMRYNICGLLTSRVACQFRSKLYCLTNGWPTSLSFNQNKHEHSKALCMMLVHDSSL